MMKRGARGVGQRARPELPGTRDRTDEAPLDFVSPAEARDFRRRLRTWFRASGRDLPWRRTRDAYRVLVSELMLQQTQVSRVLPKYEEFLGAFPTLRHVAEAEPARVTEAWRGLGYYARARNLHKLARELTRDVPDATLPADPARLRALPGIGAYTAGAVASFAYERRAPLVDTNVARVLRRVFVPHLDPKTGAGAKALWRIAEAILPRTGRAAWTHNQALMELGALVCTARLRHCAGCPVKPVCATHRKHGCPEEERRGLRAGWPAVKVRRAGSRGR
jgi:A/G-specific adenine glycosylase